LAGRRHAVQTHQIQRLLGNAGAAGALQQEFLLVHAPVRLSLFGWLDASGQVMDEW